MTRLLLQIFICIAAIAAVPGSWTLLESRQTENTATPYSEKGWHPTVSTVTNASFMWRGSPLPFRHISNQPDIFAAKFSLMMLATGLLVFISRSTPGSGFVLPIAGALSLTLGIASYFGFDHTVFSTIPWCLWLACAFASAFRSDVGKLSKYGPLFILQVWVTFNANQLSLLVAIAAFAVAWSVEKCRIPDLPAQRLLIPIASFAIPLAVLFTVPEFPFPDYPLQAHLVPDDGLPGFTRPLIGPGTPLPVIDRGAVRSAYGQLSAILLTLSCGLLLTRQIQPQSIFTTLWMPAAITALLAWIDTRLPEGLSQIGPLASASRLVPELYLIPLAPLAAGFSLVFLIAGASLQKKRWFGAFFCAIVLAASLVESTSSTSLFQPAKHPMSAGPFEGMERSAIAPIANDVFSSPSLYLLRTVGVKSLSGQREAARLGLHFHAIPAGAVMISASHDNDPKKLRFLTDRRRDKRRWSAGKGFQSGDEKLHLFFTHPTRLSGVKLFSGEFTSDFPRGLRISTARRCSMHMPGAKVIRKNYSLASALSSWQGQVKFTPAGYPYFGGQDKVQVYFPESIEARCLLIEQIGKDASFDWSVTEIEVLN